MIDIGTLLAGSGITFVGVVASKIADIKIARANKKTDTEVSRESQLWSEVHDLRNHLETSNKERIVQETACEARIDALIARHERDVSSLLTQIKALEEINKHLQEQINLLINNHVGDILPEIISATPS